MSALLVLGHILVFSLGRWRTLVCFVFLAASGGQHTHTHAQGRLAEEQRLILHSVCELLWPPSESWSRDEKNRLMSIMKLTSAEARDTSRTTLLIVLSIYFTSAATCKCSIHLPTNLSKQL
ncbi:hypothetical protein JOB18_034577 [Solea senegalensis]|uniref:Secreted protein n=1 Tax=Solea senegalensis TaxID=28829 RepID=A0AAV6RD33_SOLSE|nr:hypothetical protein JOB18_034577 [Solea senegalensis]